MGTDRSPRIVILTGERGIGKSTVCERAVALARARGFRCGGIVVPRTSPAGRAVIDVASGQLRRLTLDREAEGAVRIGRHRFDPAAFVWGNDVLLSAPPCDLFVVDELGPLEFARGRGWMAAFDVLREGDISLAVVVVRPELVDMGRSVFADEATQVLRVIAENRDVLPQTIVAVLEERS